MKGISASSSIPARSVLLTNPLDVSVADINEVRHVENPFATAVLPKPELMLGGWLRQGDAWSGCAVLLRGISIGWEESFSIKEKPCGPSKVKRKLSRAYRKHTVSLV